MINHEVERPNRGSFGETRRILKSHINFFAAASQLSEIQRQGWLDRGIKDPESVAEHSFQVAVMTAFEAGRRSLDVARAVGMALIHDLPELGAGDRTPHQDLSGWQREAALYYQWTPPSEEILEEKRKGEEKALKIIVRGLPADFRESIIGLWQEYREGQTEEAKLVHQMDVMQRLLQAKKYLKQDESFPIGPFLDEAKASGDPELRRLARSITKSLA